MLSYFKNHTYICSHVRTYASDINYGIDQSRILTLAKQASKFAHRGCIPNCVVFLIGGKIGGEFYKSVKVHYKKCQYDGNPTILMSLIKIFT